MTLHRIKHAALAAIATLALAASAFAQTVTNNSDVSYWGSGSNHAVLVISWHDGKNDSTLAWGYSWNGTATMWDMLVALAHSDPRLYARVDSATQYGPAIFGLGYDENNNGTFSVTGAQDENGNAVTPIFTVGISDTNTGASSSEAPSSSVGAAPGETDDHYAEGWFDHGYWEVFTGGTNSSYPASWTSSFGVSSITLVNNGWYALSIAGDYDPVLNASPSYPPSAAVAAAFVATSTPTPTPIPDPIAAPEVKISGKPKLTTAKAVVPIKGTVSGEASNVTYRIGNGKWQTARLASGTWRITARLKPGRNLVTVIVHGPGGDSKPVRITVIRK